MTENERERLRKQVIRAVDRGNTRWTFTGQEFTTYIDLYHDHILYRVRLVSVPGEIDAALNVMRVCGEPVAPDTYYRAEHFRGAGCYAGAVEWIADQIAAVSEKFYDQSPIWREKQDGRARVNALINGLLQ